jgi:hypothetical protein
MQKELTSEIEGLKSTVANLTSGGENDMAKMMEANEEKMRSVKVDLEAKLANEAKAAAELAAKLSALEKQRAEELANMNSSAGQASAQMLQEKADLEKKISEFSKLLGKEKLKLKASQISSDTRQSEMSRQLEVAESNSTRSLADNNALRRHMAEIESNVRLAKDVLEEVSPRALRLGT